MVAGPEVNGLSSNYETLLGKKDLCASRKHHEETGKAQRMFLDTVAKLGAPIEQMGNPFEEETPDRLILNTKDIADPTKGERHLEAKRTWDVTGEPGDSIIFHLSFLTHSACQYDVT